jgi:amino acid permease
MRIAKPILLVTTPIGVGWGLYEAWKVGWWLGMLMAVLIGLLSLFSALTVRRIRRERRDGTG